MEREICASNKRLRKEYPVFEDSLSYTVSSWLARATKRNLTQINMKIVFWAGDVAQLTTSSLTVDYIFPMTVDYIFPDCIDYIFPMTVDYIFPDCRLHPPHDCRLHLP
ncbi:hypothetical protein STEG23_027994 [Scotinomys teguina]